MPTKWPVVYFALAGALFGAAVAALVAVSGAQDLPASFSSPAAMVFGGAFWGAAVAWVRNRLGRH